MMHSLYDLILEAVINSQEAGAKNVGVSLVEKDNRIFVTVSDDGKLEVDKDAFSFGYSTKGKCRGKGLWYIKSIDSDASLDRKGRNTVLRFTFPNIPSSEAIENEIFPIFQRVMNTTLSYTKDDKKLFSISKRKDELQTVREIADFRNELRAIKGEHDV